MHGILPNLALTQARCTCNTDETAQLDTCEVPRRRAARVSDGRRPLRSGGVSDTRDTATHAGVTPARRCQFDWLQTGAFASNHLTGAFVSCKRGSVATPCHLVPTARQCDTHAHPQTAECQLSVPPPPTDIACPLSSSAATARDMSIGPSERRDAPPPAAPAGRADGRRSRFCT